MKKIILTSIAAAFTFILFAGWGSVGHSIINKAISNSFPSEMIKFRAWSDSLSKHASDADTRKSSDPAESPKHFIDIDYYPEFVANHRIPQTLDSMIAKYGSSVVTAQGTLPFAILTTIDSLRAAFTRKNFSRAMLLSADLGHYVGDGHMPLHNTQNYDGGMTNQSGIHSRYESKMVQTYQAQLVFDYDSAQYVTNVNDYVFSIIYESNSYVDSVLYADSVSKALTGSTSSAAYYTSLWNLTGNLTIKQMKNASYRLACLIYTAWKDAGQPDLLTGINDFVKHSELDLHLAAYPNPFNGQVTFRITGNALHAPSEASIGIYDITGRRVDVIHNIDPKHDANIKYSADNLCSGSYIAAVESSAGIISAIKFVILK